MSLLTGARRIPDARPALHDPAPPQGRDPIRDLQLADGAFRVVPR